MDFFLTEIKPNNQQGIRVHFPMNPEKVSMSSGVMTIDYNIHSLGEAKIPTGNRLATIQWQGTLPGEGRANAPFVKEWKDPEEIMSILQTFRKTGAALRLLITETPINMDVYIEGIEQEFAGGMGDIVYGISLTENRPIRIGTILTSEPIPASRPTAPTGKTYKTVTGDTLWKISQKTLGNGSRYMEIYNLNKATIGKDPNLIGVGVTLQLPGSAKKPAAPKKVVRTEEYLGGNLYAIKENGKIIKVEWR